MLRTFWSVKGGSGVTVTAAAVAAGMRSRDHDTVMVDLCGDQPAVLGLPEPGGPGVYDWCTSEDRRAASLARLLVRVDDDLTLLPSGDPADGPVPDVGRVADAIASLGTHVVVDAGLHRPGSERAALVRALCDRGRSYLVTRPCYLALRRAVAQGVTADGVVLVVDLGRALDRRDVADVVGLPVVAAIEVDPAVARSVDAGLLIRRHHRPMQRALRAVL